MTFFHDLNKRLATLASKQDAQQIAEETKVTAPKSKLAESIDVAEAGYSAKAGRAGKDLGKPGKNFAKIAKGAAERYGSKEAGERVAGAVLNKLRHPKEDIENEGNAFTGALAKTPKGGKFKVGSKEFTDNSSIEEGFEEMHAWLAQREKEKGTGKFDRKERTLPGGMKATTYTRRHDDEVDSDDEETTSSEPKRRGRPKGKAKGPERVTKGAWKHKGARKEKTEEDLDTDGVMMTRPTNCSSEAPGDDSAIKMAIKLLKKNGYNVAKKEAVDEKAVSTAQQKFMGMVHAAQKGEKPASKEVAKVAKEMPKKAAKDFASTKHKGLPAHVEEEGKPDFLDLDKDGNKAEPMKKAAKQAKEKKVDETTVAGSVAPVQNAAPKAGKGMQFGKGVYESLDTQFKQALTESIQVQENVAECGMEGGIPSITITADGEEAAKLMMLLKLAGLEGQQTCPTCNEAPCACAEVVDENSPDWPTNTEEIDADPELRTYSGGLNGPKSTGQSTTIGGGLPNLQARRQASMEESVKLEQTLFNTWKNYKG